MASSKPSSKNTSVDFEHQLNQLETLVSSMEQGEMSLEESLKAFEQGIQITRHCQQALKAAEQKVAILTANSDGEPSEQPFESDSADS